MTVALSSFAFSLTASIARRSSVLDRAIELADGDTDLGAGIAVGCPYAHCLIFKGGYLTKPRGARRGGVG